MKNPKQFDQLNKPNSLQICSCCVLPETFPGIRFNAKGICNHCQRFEANKDKLIDDKARYRRKFFELTSRVKQLNQTNRRPYDVLMAYSGGKDSSYTMQLLKENFDLRILAMTFNNGFVSEGALKNIHSITEALGVDHIMISPNQNFLRHAFKRSLHSPVYTLKTLERASSICNTCMNMTKSILLKYSLMLEIPMIAFGWSPGQAPVQSSVMKWNLSMLRQAQRTLMDNLGKIMNVDWRFLLIDEMEIEWFSRRQGKSGLFLYNINPLAFLEYNEGKILMNIVRLGWEAPKDTDANSTNCLLNAFANRVHEDQYGFHPYAFEIAGLVRGGHMTRQDGLAKLAVPPNEKIILETKAKLETC